MITAVLAGGENPRLAEQLGSLGVEEVHAVAEDVAAIAAALREAPAGPVVVAAADVFTQREALAGVLADPRLDTAILTAREDRGPRSFPLCSERGRAVAAASGFHTVARPTEWFLGVLKVSAQDRPALLEASDRLVALGLPGDPVALLVVALVRAGVHVGQSDLRALFWARPSSPQERARAERDVGGHDEERVLLDSSVKAIDGFFTTFLVSPYSKHLARWAARRGLSPNQVTSVSLALGLLAAGAFAAGGRWGLMAGAVLLQVAFTADCVDGQLARFTRTFTPLGAWLDSTFDRLKEYLVYGGLAVGAARAGDPVWALAGAALTLQTARHALDFAFAATEHRQMDGARQPPLSEPSDASAAPPAAGARGQRRSPRTDSRPSPGGPAGMLRGWRRLDAARGLVWVKRIIVFPIGERFAAVSVTAALWSPRTTFVVLLAWGAIAGVYALAGRVLRALAAAPARPAGRDRAGRAPGGGAQPARSGGGAEDLREDGPLARALGGLRLPLPASPLALAAAAAVAVGLALQAQPWPFVAALVVLGGLSRGGRCEDDRFRWAVPPLIRAGEYATYVWLSSRGALPLLVVLAFHHYDLVYRPRYQRRRPPPLGGGWELRVLGALILDAAGALPAALFAAAVILGALFVAEAVASWRTHDPQGAPVE